MKQCFNSASPISLVIFDCDGVLVDSEPLAMRLLLQTIAEAGAEIDAETGYDEFLGKSLTTVCELLRQQHGVDIDANGLERMRIRLYAIFREELRAIHGTHEALAALDVAFCVASSSQLERIHLALEVTGLAEYFDNNIFSASMVARGKPAPDLFLHAAEQMQMNPRNCLVIEDSPAGLLAAHEADMRAFGFTGGSHARSGVHRARLDRLQPQLVFNDMHKLPALVETINKSRTPS